MTDDWFDQQLRNAFNRSVGDRVTPEDAQRREAQRWQELRDEEWTHAGVVADSPLAHIYADTAKAWEDAKKPARQKTLEEAVGLITGDRNKQYGSPRDNFNRIAGYWNQYLADKFDPDLPWPTTVTGSDVAMMMVFVKIAREAAGYKHDSTVDAAGYIGIYDELRAEEDES